MDMLIETNVIYEQPANLSTGNLSLNIIDLIIEQDLNNSGIEKWMESAFKIAALFFGDHIGGSRKGEQVELRRAVIAATCKRWNPMYTFSNIGKLIAKYTDRNVKFDHASIIHAKNKHTEMMDNYKFGHHVYHDNFNKFYNRIVSYNMMRK